MSVDGLSQIVREAQVHYRTAGDLAYSVLRQAILTGVLAPGEPLRQDALAEALGVSRIPVRSALFQLESDGLIRLRPHRGAAVSVLTPEQVREIYAIRLLLESEAMRHAIAAMTPARLQRLHLLAGQLDAEVEGNRLIQRRIAFYRELYDAERRPLLVSLIERLRSDVGRYWLRRRVTGQYEPGHAEVLDYVRRRDTEGAIAWLRAHLQRVAEELITLVERT